MARKVGEDIESGEKNGYGEDGLGQIGQLNKEVFCEKVKGWIFFYEAS